METIRSGMELRHALRGTMTVNDVQFIFAIYFRPQVRPKKNFHWVVFVWGDNGLTAVINKVIPVQSKDENTLSAEDAEQILQAMTDWAGGYQLCSCCQTKVKKESIAGRYFAGSYCAHCWETKYRAIEARETYN